MGVALSQYRFTIGLFNGGYAQGLTKCTTISCYKPIIWILLAFCFLIPLVICTSHFNSLENIVKVNKYVIHMLYFSLLIRLSGDVELNPGPCKNYLRTMFTNLRSICTTPGGGTPYIGGGRYAPPKGPPFLGTKQLPTTLFSDSLRSQRPPISNVGGGEWSRPIVGKVLERCIFNKIYPILYPMISQKQHGFAKGRSSINQLLDVYSEINTHLDNNVQVDIAFLDFAKTFNSVPHNVLITKLPLFGINSPLLEWFRNYQMPSLMTCTKMLQLFSEVIYYKWVSGEKFPEKKEFVASGEEACQELNLPAIFHDNADIDSLWYNWKNTIMSLINSEVPLVQVRRAC